MEAILQIKQNIASNKSDKAVQDILSLLREQENPEVYQKGVTLFRRYAYLREQDQLNLIDEYFSAKEKSRLLTQLLQLVEANAASKKLKEVQQKENALYKVVNFFKAVGVFLGLFTK